MACKIDKKEALQGLWQTSPPLVGTANRANTESQVEKVGAGCFLDSQLERQSVPCPVIQITKAVGTKHTTNKNCHKK